MANTLKLFLAAEDEVQFFRFLERFKLEVYPRRIPPDWKPVIAGPDVVAELPEEDMYLAAPTIGNVLVDSIKRGPDKGYWRVDEVRSPVVFFERSRLNEEGELVSGSIWAEVDVTPETGRRTAAPDQFRKIVLEIEQWLKKTCRGSEPKGFLIGPHAARLFKEGLVLRDAEPVKQRKKGQRSVDDGKIRPFR